MKWIFGLPWDLKLGYAAVFAFLTWLAWGLWSGPFLQFFLGTLPTFLPLAVAFPIVLFQLAFRSPRLHRLLVGALIAGSLAFLKFVGAQGVVDLHLVARVYAAGGPQAVNNWAQGLMAAQPKADFRELKPDDIPSGVHAWLLGWQGIYVRDTSLDIERGGGFYHYGVIIYRTGTAPPVEWWQRALGWPQELKVYHEE